MGSIYGNDSVVSPFKSKIRYIPKNKKHEESLQRQVCHYLRLQYPRVMFRSDYASGLHLTARQASVHKNLQSGRAWPDLFIYQPMQHEDKLYSGLALELKREGTQIIVSKGPRAGHLVSNPHIQEQAAVMKDLNRLGYYANFAVGINEAIKIIDWYFKKPVNTSIF